MQDEYDCVSPDYVKGLTDRVLNISSADETEVVISGAEDALTRFAENVIHQNVVRKDVMLTVRAVVGKKMAEAMTNGLHDESLKETVQRAIDAAKQMPDDENLLERLQPQSYREVNAFDTAAASMTAGERAEQIREVVGLCNAAGMKAAGSLSNRNSFYCIANSKGNFGFYHRTQVSFSLTVMGSNGSGWADGSGFRRDAVDVMSIGKRAIQKAQAAQNPKELSPGDYTVILEPSAVADLLVFLAFGFNALDVDEGRSFLSGKMGERVFGENVNIASDVYHPLHQGCPFDVEGTPTQKVQLVEKGVAANLLYDRLTAKKHGKQPTGHALDSKGAYGAFPRCLVVDGEDNSLDDLIAQTERGLLVSRLWYNRMVDPMKVIVTGMTRDGLFLIEGGAIKQPVKNLRFNQSIIGMLNQVEAMSRPELAGAPDWESCEVVPAMRVSAFRFTSGTTF